MEFILGNSAEKAVCVPELQKPTFWVPRKILRIPLRIPRKTFTHAFYFASHGSVSSYAEAPTFELGEDKKKMAIYGPSFATILHSLTH